MRSSKRNKRRTGISMFACASVGFWESRTLVEILVKLSSHILLNDGVFPGYQMQQVENVKMHPADYNPQMHFSVLL